MNWPLYRIYSCHVTFKEKTLTPTGIYSCAMYLLGPSAVILPLKRSNDSFKKDRVKGKFSNEKKKPQRGKRRDMEWVEWKDRMEPPECFVGVFGVGLKGAGTGERVKERIYINNHCLWYSDIYVYQNVNFFLSLFKCILSLYSIFIGREHVPIFCL